MAADVEWEPTSLEPAWDRRDGWPTDEWFIDRDRGDDRGEPDLGDDY